MLLFLGICCPGSTVCHRGLAQLRGPARHTTESCSGLSLTITDLVSFFFLFTAKSVLAKFTRLELRRGDMCIMYDQNLF